MLDIKFIRENPKLVAEKSKQKGYDVDVDKLLKVDQERRKLIEEVDKIRADRKKAADARDGKKGQELKSSLKEKEDKLEKLQDEYYKLIRQIPNMPNDDVPVGKDESQNKVVRKIGEPTKFDFEPIDHLELGVKQNLIDVDRASKISGSRFAFLKNELVSLEFALVNYVLELLVKEKFTLLIPPVLVNKKAVVGLGYPEYETGEGYKVDDQYLVGTAEHAVVPMHTDETFHEKDLPRRYAAFSTAFRREAGSYGKDTKGIFRVHQFDKVEMVSFVDPKDEKKEHEYLLSLEEKIVGGLGLPYQIVKMCTGDLGFPASAKYDIETWIPSQNKYRETHSVSITGDFQARRLNIKINKGNQAEYVSILNGTAVAIGRMLIAIMENYQQKDGLILVPKALQKYTSSTKIPAQS